MKTRILLMGILCLMLVAGITWAGEKPTSETRTVDQVVDASRGTDQQIDIQPCNVGRAIMNGWCKNKFGKNTPFKDSCDGSSWCCKNGNHCVDCRNKANKAERYSTWWDRYIRCMKNDKRTQCKNMF